NASMSSSSVSHLPQASAAQEVPAAANPSPGPAAQGGQQASAVPSAMLNSQQAFMTEPDSGAQPASAGIVGRLQREGVPANLPAAHNPANPAASAEPIPASSPRTQLDDAERTGKEAANVMRPDLPAANAASLPPRAESEPLRWL